MYVMPPKKLREIEVHSTWVVCGLVQYQFFESEEQQRSKRPAAVTIVVLDCDREGKIKSKPRMTRYISPLQLLS